MMLIRFEASVPEAKNFGNKIRRPNILLATIPIYFRISHCTHGFPSNASALDGSVAVYLDTINL